MDKESLISLVRDCRADWEAVISELGPEGLERPGAAGDWRVRDVIAHCNGWDRWQLVQLRCAFSGEQPTQEEMLGGLEFPPEDHFLSEDERNEVFHLVNKDRPLDAVVGGWRELSDMRAGWVAAASQEQLDSQVGNDWSESSPGRVIRLLSEFPSAGNPKTATRYVAEQIEHQREHLDAIRAWMAQV